MVLVSRLLKWTDCPPNISLAEVAAGVGQLTRILTLDLRLLFINRVLKVVPRKDRMGESADCMLGCRAGGASLTHNVYGHILRDAATRELPWTRPGCRPGAGFCVVGGRA